MSAVCACRVGEKAGRSLRERTGHPDTHGRRTARSRRCRDCGRCRRQELWPERRADDGHPRPEWNASTAAFSDVDARGDLPVPPASKTPPARGHPPARRWRSSRPPADASGGQENGPLSLHKLWSQAQGEARNRALTERRQRGRADRWTDLSVCVPVLSPRLAAVG